MQSQECGVRQSALKGTVALLLFLFCVFSGFLPSPGAQCWPD